MPVLESSWLTSVFPPWVSDSSIIACCRSQIVYKSGYVTLVFRDDWCKDLTYPGTWNRLNALRLPLTLLTEWEDGADTLKCSQLPHTEPTSYLHFQPEQSCAQSGLWLCLCVCARGHFCGNGCLWNIMFSCSFRFLQKKRIIFHRLLYHLRP